MIVSIYLDEHEYLTDKPQTLNFGGKYIYSFLKAGNALLVRRKLNDKYIPGFFHIANSKCTIDLLSAVVGQNGVGKSSILDVIRKKFVEHQYSMPHNISTVLVEIDGMTKVLSSSAKVHLINEDNPEYTDEVYRKDFTIKNILKESDDNADSIYEEIVTVDLNTFQSIYFSPHFDLKYNNSFDEIDRYDISLDQYIKKDLENTENKGTNENGWKFALHEELLFKNSIRQVEFLSSPIYRENSVFREIFDLPQYETGILHFRNVEIPEFHNTPNRLRSILKEILAKIESENDNWTSIRKLDENHKHSNQAEINRYFLERFVIKSFISVVIQQMEKENTWLDEGAIDDPYKMDRFKKFSAFELLVYFIRESYIEKGGRKKAIFDFEQIIPFFEKLQSLFEKETNPDYINKQNIRLKLEEVKEVLELHKRIVINLLYYYPTLEGLVGNGDYTDGFVSFRPTNRNLSSGENALLNFYSKLYSFIQSNLSEEGKALPDKENYILLLDEADLGFHPIWKKKYVDALLKSIPHFFESLSIIPKLQIIITTHDPLTLSDFPINNVVFLYKDNSHCTVASEEDKNKIRKTFGANITDLLAHSFFVEDGLIGDFSKSKIQEVIKWINESKKISADRRQHTAFTDKLNHFKKVINLIDEKIVKIKLSEMITELVPDNDFYNNIIDDEIKLLQNKKR